jgi:hypothetical protein
MSTCPARPEYRIAVFSGIEDFSSGYGLCFPTVNMRSYHQLRFISDVVQCAAVLRKIMMPWSWCHIPRGRPLIRPSSSLLAFSVLVPSGQRESALTSLPPRIGQIPCSRSTDELIIETFQSFVVQEHGCETLLYGDIPSWSGTRVTLPTEPICSTLSS